MLRLFIRCHNVSTIILVMVMGWAEQTGVCVCVCVCVYTDGNMACVGVSDTRRPVPSFLLVTSVKVPLSKREWENTYKLTPDFVLELRSISEIKITFYQEISMHLVGGFICTFELAFGDFSNSWYTITHVGHPWIRVQYLSSCVCVCVCVCVL